MSEKRSGETSEQTHQTRRRGDAENENPTSYFVHPSEGIHIEAMNNKFTEIIELMWDNPRCPTY